MTFNPIAIVGRACVLPGALNPDELWQLVRDGRDAVTSVPGDRWRVPSDRVLCAPDGDSMDRAWSDRAGVVRGFDAVFDPEGFAVPSDRLQGLDPLFLWVLHTAREALRDAGDSRPGAVERKRCGAVFGNLGFPSEGMAALAESYWMGDENGVDPRNRFMAGGAAALLAESLGLEGVHGLDAACASSLYAIKLACDRLQEGAADLMLAGAVQRADDLFLRMGFCALGAFSKSGRSRPFNAGADGLVHGEGAGFVALKRLGDARRDGDHIYGVIRGIGLSNDGRGKGLLAPTDEGQRRALHQAYEGAGISPAEISLLEFHATGTAVGDGTEIRSTAAVFDGLRDVPIGSLKSNLGHLITAAGVAGLIKITEAMAAGTRPPTLNARPTLNLLEGSPFRVLHEAEPWTTVGPRVAAISAFGFGGNNAHIIVSEESDSIPSAAAAAPERIAVAVVGLGAVVGPAANRDAVARALFGEESLVESGQVRMSSVSLPLAGLRFPPADLESSLPQQLALLGAAGEALEGVAPVARERGGIFVGLEPDMEVARWGTRWRRVEAPDAKDAVVPALVSAAVVGTMPNIPANRIGSQFDFAGPGFVIYAGEDSGPQAMDLAVAALRRGELDTALVGAVDLCCEAVQQSVAKADVPGDAAVMFVLKRLDDAQAAGDPIFGLLGEPGAGEPLRLARGGLRGTLGFAGAADGLLHAFAALTCLQHRRLPGGAPWNSEDRRASFHRPGGHSGAWHASPEGSRVPSPSPTSTARHLTFGAHPPPVRIGRKAARFETMAIAPALPPVGAAVHAPTLAATGGAGGALRAVSASASTDKAEAQVAAHAVAAAPASPAPPTLPAQARQERRAPTGTPMTPKPPAAPRLPSDPALQRFTAHMAQLSELQQSFVAQQQDTHERYLAMQQNASAMLLQGYGGSPLPRQAPAPSPVVPLGSVPPVAAVPPRAAAPATAVSETAVRAAAVPAAAAPVPAPALAPETVDASPAPRVTPAPAKPAPSPVLSIVPRRSDRTGPTFTREQLMIHAGGKLSELWGEAFSKQDDYVRQVRMPLPPLLLADRVTGLRAEPGSMKSGTIWSETDVREEAWYLHHGRMAPGVLIESGQADLMLISYLGVDLTNRDERVYRLLGCEVTYHRELPRFGETLRHEIHLDGHATQGDVRLMFFHSDCYVDGEHQLSIREGQAGFFTDFELADSAGCLWKPQDCELEASPRLSPPAVECTRRALDPAQVRAFSAGDTFGCFGPGFETAQAHVRSPSIPPGQMQLVDSVSELDVGGGPWGRGYMRAELPITSDQWFFDGHFKNDPCMPGTLMLDGSLQAISIYLTSRGYTLKRDGWRFQPVLEQPYALSCRGQVTPDSKLLTYEVFVEEIIDGPKPTVVAHIMCTVDGLKAFYARRLAVELVPDWPLEANPSLIGDVGDEGPLASADGFEFGYASLIACAWGKPSKAFGPMYEVFDSPRRVARLPGPPYHFMSRVTKVDGPIGVMKAGASLELEYDIPQDAWYFDQNGARTMPFAVLLEAALQPCGWLASYVGSALTVDAELGFRNLDGTGTLLAELPPDSGTLRSVVRLTDVSATAGMIIESFEMDCYLGDVHVYEMKTVFGFFPPAALADQAGLPKSAADLELMERESTFRVDLTTRPEGYWQAGRPKLAEPMLLMIDRVTGFWPEGGPDGHPQLRAEKDVDQSEWFFKAHFFQDPVQPGSLGIEAMLQLLQFYMLETGMDAGMTNPHFEPIGLGTPVTWKYRGQVLLHNKRIGCTLEVVEQGRDEDGAWAIATASLWVDGMRIYEASNLGMRMVPGRSSLTLDPEAQPWLRDHCPTWTRPALPLMSMVDLLAQAQPRQETVVGLRDVRVKGWLVVDARRELRTAISGDVTQLLALSDGGEDEVATARVLTGSYPAPPGILPAITGTRAPDPYETGALFHGPAFQIMRSLTVGEGGASATLDAESGVPFGLLNQALLDGATHAIPHDALHSWDATLSEDKVAFPALIPEIDFFGPAPTSGLVRCEVRYAGHFGTSDFPSFRIQLIHGDRLWAQLRLVESSFPKGPLGSRAGPDRKAFLARREHVAGMSLSTFEGERTVLDESTVRESEWFPGTIEAVYGTRSHEEIALLEHHAPAHALHPSKLRASLPLTRLGGTIQNDGPRVTVTGERGGTLDISAVRAFWRRWFDRGHWPAEDLYYSLIERFTRRVVLEDPAAFEAIRGRSVVYLANHQVGVESLSFSIIASALGGVPTLTLAKMEHKHTWLGKLIEHAFQYPDIEDPGVMAFFDREDKASLMGLIGDLARDMLNPGRSVMVHVEGTRSLSCELPVQKMSGAFIDMALQVGAPVVPVRFTGGLPRQALDERIEFPVGMGRQDIHIGRPLLPEALSAMHYGARKEAVLAGINRLGPPGTDEQPLPADPALAQRVLEQQRTSGVSHPHATVRCLLDDLDAPCDEVQRLLSASSASELESDQSPEGQWLAELGRRLLGSSS